MTMVIKREPSIPPEYPFPKDLKKVLDNDINATSEASKVYKKIMDTWETAKCIDMTQNHYFQLLKIALYLEEYQCRKDMKKYDLLNRKIVKTETDKFCISTDDWVDDDEKPMIRPGDLIDIIDTTDNKLYSLRIKNIDEKLIEATGAKFLEIYSARKLYNIQFRYNNYTDRCRHYALWLAYQRNILTYLFPTNLTSTLNSTAYDLTNLTFYNTSIRSNFEQVLAVVNILQKSSFPYPYILYGPPGTGKTATIVECILQIIAQSPSNYVLVCTPSNAAADEVTKRLLDSNIEDPKLVYRMYSGSQDPTTIDKKILSSCNYEKDKMISPKEIIMRKRIVITTLCNSIKLIRMKLKCDHFSHVIIDEAGQSVEPDILIPISLVSGNGKIQSQIVLAGDPQQLGPTVISKLAENVLGRSMLERLISYPTYQKTYSGKYNPKYITKLLDNYRSHPHIIRISNALFYNNELNPKCLAGRDGFPVIFYGVSGKEEKIPNSTSSRNFEEVRIVVAKIEQLIRKQKNNKLGRLTQKDIGVVTPFKLQSQEIKRGLSRKNLKEIDVGTVELYQGQEKKIIIISTVRSKTFGKGEDEHIGSLSNPKRFNVAITRAKNLLIIVGNPNVLQADSSWRYLLKYCIVNNSYNNEHFKFNLLENSSDNYSYETSKIIKSSELFKWNKFKIFKLDELDSNTEVIETMRMILYPPAKPVPTLQNYTIPTRPVTYSYPSSYPIFRTENRSSIAPTEPKKSLCNIL